MVETKENLREPKGLAAVVKTAESIAKDSTIVSKLTNQAWIKLKKKRDIFKSFREEFYSLLRMLKAWSKGEYTKVPWQTLILAIAAALYFVNPLDAIPDFILITGFMDDATIIAFVLQSIKSDLEAFVRWEMSP